MDTCLHFCSVDCSVDRSLMSSGITIACFCVCVGWKSVVCCVCVCAPVVQKERVSKRVSRDSTLSITDVLRCIKRSTMQYVHGPTCS